MRSKLNIDKIHDKLNGYNCAIKGIVAQGGIGKTWRPLFNAIYKGVFKGEYFAYLVYNDKQIKLLSANNGYAFLAQILRELGGSASGRRLRRAIYTDDNELLLRVKSGKVYYYDQIIGGIYDLTDLNSIKNISAMNLKTVLFDEFMPKKQTFQTVAGIDNFIDIVESLVRDKGVRVHMSSNPIMLQGPILQRIFGQTQPIKPNTLYKRYDKYGLFAVLLYMDINYNSVTKTIDHYKRQSVAGRIAQAGGRTSRLFGNLEVDEKYKDLITTRTIIHEPQYNIQAGGVNVGITFINEVLYVSEYNANKPVFSAKPEFGCIENKELLKTVVTLFTQRKIRFCNDNVLNLFLSIVDLEKTK